MPQNEQMPFSFKAEARHNRIRRISCGSSTSWRGMEGARDGPFFLANVRRCSVASHRYHLISYHSTQPHFLNATLCMNLFSLSICKHLTVGVNIMGEIGQ